MHIREGEKHSHLILNPNFLRNLDRNFIIFSSMLRKLLAIYKKKQQMYV
jgi:hypothetical protein